MRCVSHGQKGVQRHPASISRDILYCYDWIQSQVRHGLLNHAEEVQHTPQRPRPRHYGPEVQHVLFLAWNAANRICAKRLIPFLPTLLEALERHEHLHISDECRRQLLAMSAATADRLLRSQRKLGQRGLSTTRAGTLLKQQIPIRSQRGQLGSALSLLRPSLAHQSS